MVKAVARWSSRYTVFQLSGEVEGSVVRPEPVVSERRFAEIADFTGMVRANDVPGQTGVSPPKEPVSFVMKNDAELVAGRVGPSVAWLSSFSLAVAV